MFNRDDPTTWATTELHQQPLGFNVSAFQKKIDKILGLTENGMPVARLVWAPDIQNTYSKFYCEWDGLFGTATELRAKYRYATLKIPGTLDTYIDIPPPRWIIEEHNSHGQMSASWEQARWNKAGKEVRPPMPLEGYYSELFTIADHNETCCEEAEKMVCWGKYRLPAQEDLDRLQMAKTLRDRDAFVDPTTPLSDETLALIKLDTRNRLEKHNADKDALIDEFIDEHAPALIEKFTGQKTNTAAFDLPKENGLIALK